MTWEARGMLAYLLSKPDDWRVQISDLRQNCGRDKVYSILAELRGFRYVLLIDIMNAKMQHLSYEYEVYEEPLPALPDTVLPYTANPDSTYKRIVQITDLSSGDDGQETPSKAKPKKAKKTPAAPTWAKEKKDSIFDYIARQSFGIALEGESTKEWGGRIGKIISALQKFEKSQKQEITLNHIERFYSSYESDPETAELSKPRDDTKFMEYFARWWTLGATGDPNKTGSPMPRSVNKPSTPVDLEEARAQIRAKLQGGQ